nr:hypothetical protein [Pandoravirus massiliensis]
MQSLFFPLLVGRVLGDAPQSAVAAILYRAESGLNNFSAWVSAQTARTSIWTGKRKRKCRLWDGAPTAWTLLPMDQIYFLSMDYLDAQKEENFFLKKSEESPSRRGDGGRRARQRDKSSGARADAQANARAHGPHRAREHENTSRQAGRACARVQNSRRACLSFFPRALE